MTRSSKSQLGESWVVDDADNSDSSHRESLSSDASDAQEHVPSSNLCNRHLASQGHRRQSKATAKSASQVREPDLVMPSLESPRRSSRANTPSNVSSGMRQRQGSKQSSTSQPQTRINGSRKALRPHTDSESTPAFDITLSYLRPIAWWLFDILGMTFNSLKTPISWMLIIYLIAGLLTLASNLLTSSIYTALSPICRVPGVSLLSLPICTYHSPHSTDPTQPTISSSADAPDPEFSSLINTQSQFESILSSTSSSLSLPLSMKRSESSIRDLRQIVRFSSLSSRNEMVLEFDNFIENARTASYDLQKFNSHVGRAVDIILSTARWTQRVLDDLSLQQTTQTQHPYLPSIMTSLLTPFRPVSFSHSALLDTYIVHSQTLTTEISSLLTEAQLLLTNLNNLEDNLEVIHSVAMRDSITSQASKDEVLSHLWTLIGGNRNLVKKYNKQLLLLREVGQYRRLAFEHVSAVILKLQSMGAELEELKERVGSAELQRDYGRTKVPLDVHLEAIRLGVERLEVAREGERARERGWVRGQMEDVQGRMLGEGREGVIGIEG